MKLSTIIKRYRKEYKLSTRSLADKIGCTNAYISLLENDKVKSPTIDFLNDLSTAMNISLNDLLEMMDDMNVSLKKDEDIYNSAKIDFIRIPLYSPICCGDGGFIEDNIIEYIPVPSKGLESPDNYYCQLAKGDSMIDAGIDDGDLLVFEKTSQVYSGMIGAFCIDENEATCKKYTESNGMIILKPMNSKYDPIPIDPLNNHFRCVGKLKKSIKNFE